MNICGLSHQKKEMNIDLSTSEILKILKEQIAALFLIFLIIN